MCYTSANQFHNFVVALPHVVNMPIIHKEFFINSVISNELKILMPHQFTMETSITSTKSSPTDSSGWKFSDT